MIQFFYTSMLKITRGSAMFFFFRIWPEWMMDEKTDEDSTSIGLE